MQLRLFRFLFIIICTLSVTANGQKLVNSPYGRFNLGNLEPAGSFRSLGMGGVSTAMRDNTSIYFSNPASYSAIDTTSFVFDFGLDYSMNFLKDNTTEYFSDDINFDHLLMGFPITKGFAVAIGVVPMSDGYYNIADKVTRFDPAYNPAIGAYTSFHKGTGGYNNYFLGTGLKITKHFSIGVNMNILSGEVNRENQFIFVDYYNMYYDNISENLHIGGINFDYGIQYHTILKKKYFFNAGVSLTSPHSYNSSYDHLSYRYTPYSTRDTVEYISDNTTKVFIPGTLRIGISFGRPNKLTAGIDYITTKWSGAKIPGAEGYTADTRSLLVGIEYIPEKYSNYSYVKRIEYRMGGHIGNNYLYVNSEQIKEYGLSMGLGFPMKRSFSKTNLFFDYTKKYGSPSNGLHTENYYTIGISLNLYDFWFLKRKYD